MYDHKVYSISERTVNISQLWFCPIVWSKAMASVELSVKFNLSLNMKGYGKIERISFESCRKLWSASESIPNTI